MNRTKFKIAVLIFGITIFASAKAFGQSQGRKDRKPPTFSELLEKMDANEDGKLSENEVKGRLKDHFSKVDTDEDGFITEEEFKNAPRPKRREREN